MPDLSPEDLENILVGDPEELDVHLSLVARDISLQGTKATAYCHCLTVDGNGKVRVARLAEFMRNTLTSYAIPRSRIEEAKNRDTKFNDTTAVNRLHYEAKNAFTDLENSGEGGELLLYLLAERFLKIPQIMCKMDLKTASGVHYHGADGVYGTVDATGILNLFWAESKLYQDASTAIRDCLKSLRPFLVEEDSETAKRERDLLLLSDKADLGSSELTAALKEYFNRAKPRSNRVRYNGIALVGFDSGIYPTNGQAVASTLITEATKEVSAWSKQIINRISAEKLESFSIHFFCVPLPSVDSLRTEFKKALGLK
jgi:hypothetical protein